MIEAVEDYLELRRLQGLKDECLSRNLRRFARDAVAQGQTHITLAFTNDWIGRTKGPYARVIRYQEVRRFSLFVSAEDDRHERLPERRGVKQQSHNKIPYIYPAVEIDAIVAWLASNEATNKHCIGAYPTIIMLLAATGMRVSEALALDRSDLRDGYLLVRKGKGGRDRRVYVDDTTQEHLTKYLEQRGQQRKSPFMFVSATGSRIKLNTLQHAFRKATIALGIGDTIGSGPPRIHDLRHRFAVRTLEATGFDPAAVDKRDIALHTHLGHACMKSTFWYLRLTQEGKSRIVNALEKQDEDRSRLVASPRNPIFYRAPRRRA